MSSFQEVNHNLIHFDITKINQTSKNKMYTNFKKNNFNIADFVFQKPRNDTHGNKRIDISNKITNDKLLISSPFMRSWGFDDFKGDNKNTLSQMFPTEEYSSTDTNNFLFMLQDFQDKVLDHVINNSEFFLGEKLNPDVIKHLFKPILILDKKGKYPPTIRPQVDCIVQGKGLKKILQWKIEIFDENKTLLFPGIATPAQLVPKNSDVTTLLRISHIWIGQNQQWKIGNPQAPGSYGGFPLG
jgi:hypothetical protein